MTTTANLGPFDATFSETGDQPDLLENLMWDRGLKMLYWWVGDPQRVDEDDPETTMVAAFEVVWFNGRRHFHSHVVLDYDVIHALVGQDEVSAGDTDHALQLILEYATEIPEANLARYAAEESWAAGTDRPLGDCEMLRGAALAIGGEWGLLLEAVGTMVETLPQGLSFAHPKARVASIAVQIAWDLL